jgi:hypothetical protein
MARMGSSYREAAAGCIAQGITHVTAQPPHRLAAVAAALGDGKPLDEGIRQWFLDAVQTILVGAQSADVALDLRVAPGQRGRKTIATDEARYARIRYIGVTFWPNANASESARQFHRALSQYHGGRWRRDRLCTECPVGLSPLHQEFWHLLKLHDRVLSEDRLRRILGCELPAIHDRDNRQS